MKIKLSKKKPLKIAAGAPNRQSETIPMELERNWGPKRTVPGLHGSSTSKSTLHTKGTGAPSCIPSICPENVGPQKGTFIRKENDLKCNTNYGLSKEGVNQAQGSACLLYTSPSPRDATLSRMPSSA